MTLIANCQGGTRRDCLKLGLSAAIGGGFVDLLRLRGAAAEGQAASAKRKSSCILVWLDGGPSHYETFDLKPDAPREIRGKFDPIPTCVPGMQIAEHMPKLAAIADKYALVRSIRHDQGNHGAGNHYMMTGAPPRIPVGCGAFVSFHPSFGAATSYERGMSGGLPAYFSMPSMTRSGGPSWLGAKYAPFVVNDDPNSSDFRVRDVALPKGLEGDRFASRREIRQEIDRLQRYADKAVGDPVSALDEYYVQGYDLVTSKEAQQAFDINAEPEKLRERYGRNGFGQRAMLARRLVEAGVPFITLNEGGWDHHSDVFGALEKRLPTFDATLATLLTDLEERGLLDTTLVLVLGEFGRSPQVNNNAGRDHWANAMSVLMAGCRIPGGQVVGATDRNGYAAVERVLSPENFAATVYSKLGIDPNTIYHTSQSRPVHLVSDPQPIRELMA